MRSPLACCFLEERDISYAPNIGFVDDRRGGFTAPHVGQHLGHVPGEDHLVLERLPLAKPRKRLLGILPDRHAARMPDREHLAFAEPIEHLKTPGLAPLGANQDELIRRDHNARRWLRETFADELVYRLRAGRQECLERRAAFDLDAKVAGCAIGRRYLGSP